MAPQVVDESEVLSYRLRLEEWERQQEERKHTFNITDREAASNRQQGAGNKSKVRTYVADTVDAVYKPAGCSVYQCDEEDNCCI